jgi:sugar/nucleoside kinase (ribokinase family)
MARVLVAGGLGWDVPLWLDRPLTPGGRISARSLPAGDNGGPLPGRLGGGAANIGAALALAGHEVRVVGRVGRDAAGEHVLSALRDRKIGVEAVLVDDWPTSSVQLLIEPNGERTILGIIRTRPAAPIWSLDSRHVGNFAPAAIVLRASAPAVSLAVPQFDALLGKACLVVAHMPWRGPVPARVDVAVGSQDDLGAKAYSHPLRTARGVFGCARWGVVTAGASGARAQSDTETLTAAAEATAVVDTTGAGDIFMAGLTDALLAGAGMAAALAHGCRWSAAAVGIEGSAPARGAVDIVGFIRASDAT